MYCIKYMEAAKLFDVTLTVCTLLIAHFYRNSFNTRAPLLTLIQFTRATYSKLTMIVHEIFKALASLSSV